eukprot:TRINITY_DN529_c2_g3_i1.p1 TRINITY_DN529_c2_g3~~TRINITY_DN529_c2_g3_i1.p1  ORF type:complete len:1003 (-),score=261.29 TRINITY_DN529_c2_g3_i1:65-2875(-)
MASFIATLTPDLREEVFLSVDDHIIDTLPPALAAEAHTVRERAARGYVPPSARRTSGDRRAPSSSRPAPEAVVVDHEGNSLLEADDLSCVLRLLYVDSPKVQLAALLALACLYSNSREALLQRMLAVLCHRRDAPVMTASCVSLASFLASKADALVSDCGRFSPLENPGHPLLGPEPCFRAVTRHPPPLVCLRLLDILLKLARDLPPVARALVAGFATPLLPQLSESGLPLLLALLDMPPFTVSASHVDRLLRLLALLASKIELPASDKEKEKEEAKDKQTPRPVALQCPRIAAASLGHLVQVLSKGDALGEETLRNAAAVVSRLALQPQNRGALLSALDHAAESMLAGVAEHLAAVCAKLEDQRATPAAIAAMCVSAAAASPAQTLLRIVNMRRDLCEQQQQPEAADSEAARQRFALLWPVLTRCLDCVAILDKRQQQQQQPPDGEAAAADATPLLAVASRLRRNRQAQQKQTGVSPAMSLLLPVVQLFFVMNAPPQQPQPALLTSSDQQPAESEYNQFVEKYKLALNEMIHANPTLLAAGGSLEVLLRTPRVLDFDNKRLYFRMRLQQARERDRDRYPGLRLNVRRSHIFEDSFHNLRMRTADELRGRMSVHFSGEEGIDAGGLTKEWYQVISREMFNPNYALFKQSDDGAYQPNPSSYVNADHLDYLKFVGRVVGKALYDGQLLDAHFTRSFYKHMLGQKVSVKDMDSVDHGFYKNLMWLLEHNLADAGVELTFSAESDVFGRLQVVDLKPNGRQVPVTDENKREYVRLVVEHKLTTSIVKQIEAFLAGFRELVPQELTSVFSENELELLISGLPEIDLEDLRANTEYHGYTAESPQIQWFWHSLGEFSQQERAEMLQFVTGSSKVPLEGFGALSGMHGVTKFAIHKTYRADGLPTAHTCFNQLDLPEYPTYEVLKSSLLLAVREGCEGFGFG